MLGGVGIRDCGGGAERGAAAAEPAIAAGMSNATVAPIAISAPSRVLILPLASTSPLIGASPTPL